MSLSEIKFEHTNSAILRELVSLQVDVAREPVRVLGHDLHAIRAAGLVDPHRTYRADPWLCRKTMISRAIFCSAQTAVIRWARDRTQFIEPVQNPFCGEALQCGTSFRYTAKML
jgi:hypothetical protein